MMKSRSVLMAALFGLSAMGPNDVVFEYKHKPSLQPPAFMPRRKYKARKHQEYGVRIYAGGAITRNLPRSKARRI